MALFNASSNTFEEWTSNPGDPRLLAQDVQRIDGRSLPEMIIKAVVFMSTATIAATHLTQLRKQPNSLAFYQVIASMLTPMFPLADFMISCRRTLKAMNATGKMTWGSYHNACILDVRAESENKKDTVPLHLVPLSQVKPVVLPYDVQWLVRLVIQSVFLLQTIHVMLMWAHRAAYGRRAFYDDWMALTALSGFQTMLLSLGITIMNTAWTCPQRYPPIFSSRFAEATLFDLMTFVDPYEVQLASVIATLFRFGTVQSLRNNFAVEFYHLWQVDCLNRGNSAEDSDQITLIGTRILSHMFDVKLYPCDPQRVRTSNNNGSIIGGAFQLYASFAMISSYILSWYAAILLAFIVLVSVCTLLNIPLKISRERWTRAIFHCHCASAYVAYTILTLGIWQLTDPSSVAWAWKWKDPWAGRYWTFTS